MDYRVWIIVFLIVCAITDLKERKIYGTYCFINVAFALVVHICERDMHWGEIVGGIALGVMFFIISIVSKEALGMGDALIILTLGSIGGITTSFELLLWAFIICAMVSIVGLLLRKRQLNSQIPFAPFLLVGGIANLIMQEVPI